MVSHHGTVGAELPELRATEPHALRLSCVHPLGALSDGVQSAAQILSQNLSGEFADGDVLLCR